MPVELLPAKSQISGQQRGLGGVPLENPLVIGNNLVQLTTTGATSLTLPTSGTVTAQGNSVTGTLGSLVASNAPTLIGKVAINSSGSNGNTLTVADAAGDTTIPGVGVINLTLAHVTTGIGFYTNATAMTSGTLWDINASGTAFTGNGIFVNIGFGGGSFNSGNFLNLQNNSSSVCVIANTGQVAISLTGTGSSLDLSGGSATTAFKTSTTMQIAAGSSHVATLVDVPAGVATGAQTGWIAFALSSGATHYLAYW